MISNTVALNVLPVDIIGIVIYRLQFYPLFQGAYKQIDLEHLGLFELVFLEISVVVIMVNLLIFVMNLTVAWSWKSQVVILSVLLHTFFFSFSIRHKSVRIDSYLIFKQYSGVWIGCFFLGKNSWAGSEKGNKGIFAIKIVLFFATYCFFKVYSSWKSWNDLLGNLPIINWWKKNIIWTNTNQITKDSTIV